MNETGGEELSSNGRAKPNSDEIVRGEPMAKCHSQKRHGSGVFWANE
jgi:hypothetical protein